MNTSETPFSLSGRECESINTTVLACELANAICKLVGSDEQVDVVKVFEQSMTFSGFSNDQLHQIWSVFLAGHKAAVNVAARLRDERN